jgi:hypothetical protein
MSATNQSYENVIERVRENSVPIQTRPVGWSHKTELIIELLRQNHPAQSKFLPEHVKRDLQIIKKMPEPRNYLPWFRVGPGFKEIYAEQINPTIISSQSVDYCEY